MKNILKSLLLGVTAAAFAAPALADDIAITNAKVLMTQNGTIESGTVIISGSKIKSVGSNVSVPNGYRVIDAKGGVVTPGLFSPISGTALVEVSMNNEANETSANSSFPLSAALNAVDGLNPDSTIIPINRAAGVTAAYTTTSQGGKIFGGCGAVISFSGAPDPVLKSCIAQNTLLGFAGADKSGDTKTGSLAMLRLYLSEAKRFAASPDRYRAANSDTGLTYLDLNALIPAVRGQQKMLIHVNSAPDIRSALKIANEYNLDIILVGAKEAWRVAVDIAAANVPVILNPTDNLPSGFEAMAATLSNAERLAAAGVTIAFYDSGIGYTHNTRSLPQLAGIAVANGLDYDTAIAAITANPAKIWGLGDKMGTLARGKRADIVVWNGDPLELASRPIAVIIDGKLSDLDNRQAALARRYKDLSRKDLPRSYMGGEP